MKRSGNSIKCVPDKDLLALDPDNSVPGPDRAARMNKVYAEEMAKRKLKARGV
jgi:hypothetical protein